MKQILLLFVIVAASFAVLAQSNTIVSVTLTPNQVRAIQASIPRQNNTNVVDVASYVQHVVNLDVSQRVAELRGAEIAPLRERWDSLTETQRSNVLAAAGITR